MRFVKFSLYLLFLFCVLYGNLQAQTRIFSKAEGVAVKWKYYHFEKWKFSLGANRYEINRDGSGKRLNSQNESLKFRLSLEEDGFLDRAIYFAEYENDLLLISEIDYGCSGAGFILRLDGKTLKTKWMTDILGFNVPRGLIENNSAYLGGLGFAGKINLDTGKYIWKHEEFYRKYKESGAFNIFETPVIKGNEIIYTENREKYGDPSNVIVFDKMNGKVIKVIVN